MEELDSKYKALSRKRAGYKGRITAALNNLDKLDVSTLTEEIFVSRKEDILSYLGKVDDVNDLILELFEEASLEEDDENRVKEMENQVAYRVSITDKLATSFTKFKKDKSPSQQGNKFSSVKMPELKCKTFSGKSLDKLEFKNFLQQFQNCIDACDSLSDASKLTYLRSFLTDYAFKTISHLSITDGNYLVALQLLKDEFLDEEYIVDEIFKQMLNKQPKYDPSFGEVRMYVNECKSFLYELKTYKIDLLNVDSAGCKLVSHIIFSKLPASIKRELIHKVDTNYPTIVDLFDHFNDIIKTLLRTSVVNRSLTENKDTFKVKTRSFTKSNNSNSVKTEESNSSNTTLENFNTSVSNNGEQVRFCKFCAIKGHSMVSCSKYNTLDSRKGRCKELKLCFCCSSGKHLSDKCPGKDNLLSFPCYFCKSKAHISALCPVNKNSGSTTSNLCINIGTSSSYQPFLLPIINLSFARGGRSCNVRCLVDDGSQRSYLSQEVMNILNCDTEDWAHLNYDVKTFLGSTKRNFKECVMEVGIPGYRSLPLPILIDNEFEIKFQVSDLPVAINNIVHEGFKLADPTLSEHGEHIILQGLLGVDVIQFIPKMEKIKCMMGTAWLLSSGIVPFGNIMHFLHPHQINETPVLESTESNTCVNFVNAVELYGSGTPSSINFVLEPKKTYFNPLEVTFTDSSVEQGLENMFSLESIGCSESNEDQSKYDLNKIEDFQSKIELRDNRYFVSLPWHENIISDVPSNEKVAIAILDKVVAKLKQKGLLEAYQEVFHKQLEDNIIEKIEVSPESFHNHVWIPHRPVIKTEANVTTKIRPVFNCSLKVNNKPSLNEAAYAGVNLMTDLTKLVMYFRSNKYIMLSDIKQAFLQIRLANEEDKNRFSFFMMEKEQLVAYRYTTIIFGFNASPFILNYVIKHHVGQYEDDDCTSILKNNFYVDNLIVTGNCEKKLNELYRESNVRMEDGGFQLRSWNSNNENLRDVFNKDDKIVQHNNDYEMVLGYKYLVFKDEIQLARNELDPDADTKRKILSQISKIFDPLGLCLPVTTCGKILMRDLWSKKLSWDETVPELERNQWQKLCGDLTGLFSLTFPRNCINEDCENNLVVFCDASKSCYGFSVYNVSNGNSQLMFAKAKVSPQKKRTLPTLELMSVYLALKCLPLILDSFPSIKFKDLVVVVDSQIVLSWLLSETVKTKNVFTLNRIKDIAFFKKDISERYLTDISFKFVNSEDNPADLLTRGLTLKEFEKKKEFWYTGPQWLSTVPISWPDSSLGCLSEKSKQLVNVNLGINANDINPVHEPILDIHKFSSLNKLLGVTKYIFKFLSKCKKSDEDPLEAAKLYWFRYMQLSEFPHELQYLKDNQNQKIPELVNRLDLFLDSKGIMRSKGRIGKTLMYDYDVINPVLLAKDHPLTTLIVESYHRRCKHLGIQSTLNAVRIGGFWIPRMRQSIKKIIGQCMVCQRFNSLSFKYPKMTNLPKHRVNLVKPFNHTGVDYTSHLWVQDTTTGKNTKMYLLIFTCLNVRAVHIELVPDMTTQSFVLAFLRFVNLYGVPSTLYSDNAKTFIAGGNILEQAMITDEFNSQFQNFNIKHIRIPTYSAWVGSTWERLIRTIKSCLYKTVGRARLDYFTLLTIIGDIQSAINSRPLTYRSSDDDLEIITPNSFLKFNTNPFLLLRQSDDSSIWNSDPPSRDVLLESLNVRNELFSHFRDKWYENYLLSLREQHRDLHENNWVNRMKAGDVVLIKHPNKPRPYWLLGRILELVVGYDNKVRSVKLKRGDGQIAYHSINHLFPLELSLTHSHSESSSAYNVSDENKDAEPKEVDDNTADNPQCDFPSYNEDSIDVVDNVASSGNTVALRPKRSAAEACKDKMREWCHTLKQ